MINRLSRKDLHARQFLRLSGLGTASFAKAKQGILNIHSCTAARLPNTNLNGLRDLEERGFPVIEVGNRYFASQEEAGDADPVLLDKFVDPFGILTQLGAEKRGIHIEDNTVQYFERTFVQEGELR